jgi:hypothetical protein
MSKVTNFTWEAEVTLTRGQIVALGLLSEYVANIETDMKLHFPSGTADINWDRIREAFSEFGRAYQKDQEIYKELSKQVTQINAKPNRQIPSTNT